MTLVQPLQYTVNLLYSTCTVQCSRVCSATRARIPTRAQQCWEWRRGFRQQARISYWLNSELGTGVLYDAVSSASVKYEHGLHIHTLWRPCAIICTPHSIAHVNKEDETPFYHTKRLRTAPVLKNGILSLRFPFPWGR